jgi:hypothetical protein
VSDALDLLPEAFDDKQKEGAATKGKTEDIIFSNFEVNSYQSKQVQADNSAVAVSSIKESSFK